MRYIVYRIIKDRVYYWNTCGWTRNLLVARAYTHHDARDVVARMSKYGRVMLAPLRKMSRA